MEQSRSKSIQVKKDKSFLEKSVLDKSALEKSSREKSSLRIKEIIEQKEAKEFSPKKPVKKKVFIFYSILFCKSFMLSKGKSKLFH